MIFHADGLGWQLRAEGINEQANHVGHVLLLKVAEHVENHTEKRGTLPKDREAVHAALDDCL